MNSGKDPDTLCERIRAVSRTFAYARVSTAGQTTENQVREIAAAGFAVEPHRVVSETVSGSEAIARREGFARLLDRMEAGDVLVVTRLDRLGRDAIDVSATVARLEGAGVRVHCLALGGVDRGQGKRLGRPHSLDPATRAAILAGLARGESLSALARRHKTSRQTVMRLRDSEQAQADG